MSMWCVFELTSTLPFKANEKSVQFNEAIMTVTYRAILRSRRMSSQPAAGLIWRGSVIFTNWSERFGLIQLMKNGLCLLLLLLFYLPALILSIVTEMLAKLLTCYYKKCNSIVKWSLPWHQKNEEILFTVHLIPNRISVPYLHQRIHGCLIKYKPFILCRRKIFNGWFNIWSPPRPAFHVANHVIELSPTWKHRLVTQDTIHEFVSEMCTQPLSRNLSPWRIFIIFYPNGNKTDQTCLVTQCHRSLASPLYSFLQHCLNEMAIYENSHSLLVQMEGQEYRYGSLSLEWNRFSDVESTPVTVELFHIWKTIPHHLHGLYHSTKLGMISILEEMTGRMRLIMFHGYRTMKHFTWKWINLWKTNLQRFMILVTSYWNILRIIMDEMWLNWTVHCKMMMTLSVSSTQSKYSIHWTEAIPRHEMESVCSAARATIEDILLTALSLAVNDYMKQLGSCPDQPLLLNILPSMDLSPCCDAEMAGQEIKCEIALPCTVDDSRLVLQWIQQQMSRLRQQRMKFRMLNQWIHFCIRYMPWPIVNWVLSICQSQAPISLETIVLDLDKKSASIVDTVLFRWNASSNRTQLRLCLCISSSSVHLGAMSRVLSQHQLIGIVDHFQRGFYQLAASFGVQKRRLSPHSSPIWTSDSSPTPIGIRPIFSFLHSGRNSDHLLQH